MFKRLSEIDNLPVFRTSSHRTATIYGLEDPRDRTIRYIGVSGDPRRRLVHHLKNPPNRGMYDWIQELRIWGVIPRVVALAKVCCETWADAERAWIRLFREAGELLNVHEGGLQGEERGGGPRFVDTNRKWGKKKKQASPKRGRPRRKKRGRSIIGNFRVT